MWDIRLGEEYDLRQPLIVRRLIGWLKAGLVSGLFLAPPCSTFSQARLAAEDVEPLRAPSRPWGLPSAWRPWQAAALRDGTLLALVACRLFQAALVRGLPVALEQPETSIMWAQPPHAALARDRRTLRLTTEMCMWGAPWRKPTSLLAAGLDLHRVAARRCASTHECARSGKAHRALRGRAPNGKWWTAIAQAYRRNFCAAIADAFADAHVRHRHERLCSLLAPASQT